VRYRAHEDVVSAEFVSGKVSIGYKIHHARREQYFKIQRVEKEYSIKAYLSSGEFEHHLIKGFGKEPAVFRTSERDSVRLASHRVLRPGSYLIATNRPIIDRLIPELHAESLKTIEGIYAVLIDIPEDPGPKILGNIQAVLGFDVTSTIASYAFLSPQIVTEIAADCWEVSIADAIVCYIRLSQHIAASKLLIQRRKRGQLFVEYLQLDKDGSEFVVEADALGQDVDLFRIGVMADRPQFLCEIRRSNDAIDPRSARLVFNMSESDRSSRLLWSSHKLPNALKLVRKGQLRVESVLLPRGVEIHLGESTGKHALLSGENIADGLTDFLKNSRLPCTLRATGHPPIVLWPQKDSKKISVSESGAKLVAIRSRADARLVAAFRRNRASAYSIRSLR
jgi:hypothetical protein